MRKFAILAVLAAALITFGCDDKKEGVDVQVDESGNVKIEADGVKIEAKGEGDAKAKVEVKDGEVKVDTAEAKVEVKDGAADVKTKDGATVKTDGEGNAEIKSGNIKVTGDSVEVGNIKVKGL